MAAIITQKYRQLMANLFRDFVDGTDPTKNLYLFIGRSMPWPVSDELPPLPLDTAERQRSIWNEILALKQVKNPDTFFVIPRRNWDETGETVYVPYSDNDPILHQHPTDAEILAGQSALDPYIAGSFYVITDEFHVFKCLENNNGSKSTVKPVKPLVAPFIYQGADGYKWKYMFTVPALEVEKFVTDIWIPVKTLDADDGSDQWLVQQDALANSGAIYNVLVENSGINYFDVQDADPDNPDPQNIVSATPTTAVLSIDASAFNNAYNGATIWIVNGTGAGQSRVIDTYIGATREATLETSWGVTPDATSEYQILPTITITGDGSGAVAKPVVVGGQITKVNMVSVGSDYNFAIVNVSGGGGSNAVLEAQLGPGAGHGADAVCELGASYVMLTISLEYDEGDGDFPVVNDYRIIGLIRDVIDNNTNDIATDDTLIGVPKLELSGLTGTFLSDEIILGGTTNTEANVLQFDDLGAGDASITYIQTPEMTLNSFAIGEIVTGQSSGATAVISNFVQAEAKKFSGELLALEHRRPITRASDQKERIKFVLRF